ncbi:MAG: nucleotidyl transferase AbiEii/AbiGii toxin family protein [Oscillospiraceae bacterium]|nr:nucleotidyl transferase AbiEii/AbiGii toxin family protein [Oscillospiraceae bacterium]
MTDLEALAEEYRKEGYSAANAEARVCQDIVLKAISESSLSRNVTIKGGVVMRSITGNIRRATQDMDLDFIRYSLEESSIRRFIEKLNCLEEISIRISGNIEELSQQEYRGKRVYVILSDMLGHSLKSKIDLGVHKNAQIVQEEYCFDVCLDEEGASLLINSKEQIFAEKLRSLLRFGPLSTRYKDIFDLCYLTETVDPERLRVCIKTYIFSEPRMKETDMAALRNRVVMTFSNERYRTNLKNASRANWLGVTSEEALRRITAFLQTME